jgi:anti-sigma factor RsiW
MDDDRLDELFDRYLDRELNAAEEAELIELLRRPELQARWRQLASLEGKIQEELLAVPSEIEKAGAPGSPIPDRSLSKKTRRPTRRCTRRSHAASRSTTTTAGRAATTWTSATGRSGTSPTWSRSGQARANSSTRSTTRRRGH